MLFHLNMTVENRCVGNETQVVESEMCHYLQKYHDKHILTLKEAQEIALLQEGVIKEKRQDIMMEAVKKGDFNTFQELTTDTNERSGVMDEKTFNTFVEAHSLREDGKYDEARKLFEEINWRGFKKDHSRHFGEGWK